MQISHLQLSKLTNTDVPKYCFILALCVYSREGVFAVFAGVQLPSQNAGGIPADQACAQALGMMGGDGVGAQ